MQVHDAMHYMAIQTATRRVFVEGQYKKIYHQLNYYYVQKLRQPYIKT